MAQLFSRGANWALRAGVAAILTGGVAVALLVANSSRSDFLTKVNVPRDQPVPFSHKHHVTGMGIDCRYCHTSVESAAFAGVPPTETCMTCHSQIWTEAPALEPVRASFRDRLPLRWTRVHDLPDFVYFNHSIHVAKGVGCETCHGRVDQMPLTWKAQTLNMEWCLGCHRDPAKFLRPRDQVVTMGYQPPVDQAVLGQRLVTEYGVNTQQLTDCSICHR
ncbi:MAG: cytochrome c3 family protein [Candidatus Latescibacterota bacterium]|jgi:hypothetical protein